MMRIVLLYVLLLSSMAVHATEWERVLQQGKLNSSSVSVAGTIVQSDTLRLTRNYNPTDVSLHFVSARVTDSLFNDYVSRTRKEDSIQRRKQILEFALMARKERANAIKSKQPPQVFIEPSEELRPFIYDMEDVKRFRIKVTEVLKAGEDVERGDTITVIVLPAHRWDTTTSIRKGKVVVYCKPYENKERVIDNKYFNADMLDFYRREKIYIVAADRIEPEQWKAILVQY